MSINKKRIWIFTFEYAGVAKIGGLGEVPANQAKHLAKEFDITVFMPSHGQIDRLKSLYKYEKFQFTCGGQLDPSILGSRGLELNYRISYYKFTIDGVNIILISGDDGVTSRFLDDDIVYNPDTIKGKICLYSLGIRGLVNHMINADKQYLPNIVHMHDYHVVIPFIGMKQELNKFDMEVNSLITIHLLTWPRFEMDFYKICGIRNTPIRISLKVGFQNLTLEEIFRLTGDLYNSEPPTVEKIGAIVADLVTTVSESYLISDVIPNCGQELIEFKADFIWDGCDWDYNEIFNQVLEIHGEEILDFSNLDFVSQINHENLRSYLLEFKLGNLSQSPIIKSQNVLDEINEISNGNPFIKNGNVKAFTESGPLVLTTGRISPQKGFEIIFDAIPKVLEIIPSAKFLFLIIPTDYSLDEIKLYSTFVKKYSRSVRIIFGVAEDIFYLAHISTDVYCALSRWEPFGIMALEAMALKIPIIATKVGGLQETIVDIRDFPKIGTGIVIDKENPSQFADALISLFKSLEVAINVKETKNHSVYETKILNTINEIPDVIIKSNVLLDPNYYFKIQENCYNRVKENFTWAIVSKKLIDLYNKLSVLKS